MSIIAQIVVAIASGSILGAATTIINQWVIASRLKVRMDLAEQRTDERHAENKVTLSEIRSDVKRINGTVGRHDERLRMHDEEIERLRGHGTQ